MMTDYSECDFSEVLRSVGLSPKSAKGIRARGLLIFILNKYEKDRAIERKQTPAERLAVLSSRIADWPLALLAKMQDCDPTQEIRKGAQQMERAIRSYIGFQHSGRRPSSARYMLVKHLAAWAWRELRHKGVLVYGPEVKKVVAEVLQAAGIPLTDYEFNPTKFNKLFLTFERRGRGRPRKIHS